MRDRQWRREQRNRAIAKKQRILDEVWHHSSPEKWRGPERLNSFYIRSREEKLKELIECGAILEWTSETTTNAFGEEVTRPAVIVLAVKNKDSMWRWNPTSGKLDKGKVPSGACPCCYESTVPVAVDRKVIEPTEDLELTSHMQEKMRKGFHAKRY